MFVVTVEPDSVIVAVTKIGALLGLLKLSLFVTAFNEWRFLRVLKREFIEKKVITASINRETIDIDNYVEVEPLSYNEFYSFK